MAPTSKPQDRWTVERKKFLKEKSKLKDWSDKMKKIYDEVDDPVESKSKKFKNDNTKVNRYHGGMKTFLENKAKKEEKRKAFEKREKEREEAMERHDSEQKRKRKLLYKKNFKGQPNMSVRMQLLLEKIQKQKEQPS